MSSVKPYRCVPIQECGEPLIFVPKDAFAFFEPHPYVLLGAPYGSNSPWMLRESVYNALLRVQQRLQSLEDKSGWRIKLFDAYRPNEVQQFMVDRELLSVATFEGLDPDHLSLTEKERLMEKVYRVFAIPSDDPATPPPHSTGAAIDCTLIDDKGNEIDMGSPIDENSDRSYPNFFASVKGAEQAHAYRQLLNEIMEAEGFRRNPGEWWHFSMGDQLALWVDREKNPNGFAIYGRADRIDPFLVATPMDSLTSQPSMPRRLHKGPTGTLS